MPTEEASYHLGQRVVAPMLLPYCDWVKQMATDLKLESLLFVARDGQLPYLLIIENLKQPLPFEVHYCYAGSRTSWYPCIPHLLPKSILKTRIKNEYHSVANTCKALGIPREVNTTFPHDKRLTTSEIDAFVDFLTSPSIRSQLREWSSPARERLLLYLRKFGVGVYKRCGLVDLGWHGRFQTALEQMLWNTPTDLFGLYFGLNENVDSQRRFSFAFGPKLKPHFLSFYPCVLETLCPADHPSVKGFTEEADPIFDTCLVAPKNIISAIHFGTLSGPSRQPIPLEKFIHSPPSFAIDVFSNFRFQHPFRSDSDEAFVRRHKLKDAVQLLLNPKRSLHSWHWPQVNLVTSGLPTLGLVHSKKFQYSSVFLHLQQRFLRCLKYLFTFFQYISVQFLPDRSNLVSFDVFDTLIYRQSGVPNSVFQLMESQTGIPGLAKTRKAAELYLARIKGNGEVTLDSIYTYLMQKFPEINWAPLKDLELAIESEQLRSSPRGMKSLEKYRGKGYQILLISDMYLPGSWIEAQLKRMEIMKEGDRLFVSSELQCTKSEGQLFREVREAYSLLRWRHFGDNLHTDVYKAMRAGLYATWLPHSFTSSLKSFARTLRSH